MGKGKRSGNVCAAPVVLLVYEAPMISKSTAFLTRHRVPLAELVLLGLSITVLGFLFFEFDIFRGEGSAPTSVKSLQLDEIIVLGAVLISGLLLFAWNRIRRANVEMRKRLASEEAYRVLASEDPLTGLPNRRQFEEALAAALHAPPGANLTHALMYLDLNGFKSINDVYGHNIGDETLRVVAKRLRGAMREQAMVARLGGDEFAILVQQLPSAEAMLSLANRIKETLREPISVEGINHPVGTGIGICLFPFEGATPHEVMRRADVALYRAKGDHSLAPHFFDASMDAAVREHEEIARELDAAIQRGDIRPSYQPLVDLKSDRVVGFEALARWTHPTLGSISPERFIPVAEESGLIADLTEQLLEEACTAAMDWPADITLAFNLSPIQLRDAGLGLRIMTILGRTGLLPSRLEIEITESALVRELENAQRVLGSLRKIGVRIALDDFGTGYSSLYHLRNFKVDKIKIDRSFISTMQLERESAEIVSALLGLGKGLGLTITAEGIEDGIQQEILKDKGCQQGQGYLFGKAMTAAEAAKLVYPRRAEMVPGVD